MRRESRLWTAELESRSCILEPVIIIELELREARPGDVLDAQIVYPNEIADLRFGLKIQQTPQRRCACLLGFGCGGCIREGVQYLCDAYQIDSRPETIHEPHDTCTETLNGIHYPAGKGERHCSLIPSSKLLRHNNGDCGAPFGICGAPLGIAAPHLAFAPPHWRLRRLIWHLRRTIGDCGASSGICAATLAIAAPHLAFEAQHWRLRRLIRHLRHNI